MFVVAATLVIARRPDAITNPQFWAEDGKYWFGDAYNNGLHSLVQSVEGYLLTLPRLVALPLTGASLGHAALAYNLVGLAVQVAPAAFFVSRRFEHVVPRTWVRALIGLGYVLIPSFELNVTLTNAQWHLAILALLTLIARPPLSLAARVLDVVVLVLSGLTGPFALILLPVAVARAVTLRAWRRWYAAVSGLLLTTLAVQAVAVHLGFRDPVAPLGVSFRNAVTILADRVVLPGTFAEEGHAHVYTAASAHPLLFATLISAAASCIGVSAVIRGSAALRLFLLAAAALTALCLLSPIATPPNTTAWTALATSDGGERYFVVGEVAWFVCLVWAISRIPARWGRAAAAAALAAVFASGLIAAWSYPAYVDLHPAVYTAQLRQARVGTTVVVPLNPGPPWAIDLVKH